MGDRDRRLAAVAAQQHGIFTGGQAVAAGFPRRTVRSRSASGVWVRMYGDTFRTAATPSGQPQKTMSAWLACGSPAAVAGTSAAVLWDLGLPEPAVPRIVVPIPRHPRPAGVEVVRTSRWGRLEVVRRGPLYVTTRARTLLDLAAHLPDTELEAALDRAHRNGLDLRRLRDHLRSHRGIPGAGRLAELLRHRDPDRPIESELKTRLFAILREARLPLPVPQLVIQTSAGRRRLDFAYPRQRVALEVDGYRAHHGRRAFDDDRGRANAVREAGWDLRHVTSTMLDHPSQVVWTVSAALGLRPVAWR